jgi:chloride channel protein, CIC family
LSQGPAGARSDLQHPLAGLVLGVLGSVALLLTGSASIFGPSLYIGAMLGGVVGTLASAVLADPGTRPGAFVLVGMGAMFAGVVRAPITSIVMIFEMRNNYSVILPLMAANITSYAMARRLSPVTLQANATVEETAVRLRRMPRSHKAYPLLDDAGGLVGVVGLADIERGADAGEGCRRLLELGRTPSVHARPDHSLDAVLVKLGQLGVSELPVVSRQDPTKLLGIVSMRDVARALARAANEGEG